MTLYEFEDLLDTLGPELDRWPTDLRMAAEALLSTDPAARQALDAARMVAATLAELPGERASDALRRAVLDIPLARPRSVATPGLLDRLFGGTAAAWRAWTAGAVAASAAMLMGFYLGYGGLLTLPGLTGNADVATITPEQELVELIAALDVTEIAQ